VRFDNADDFKRWLPFYFKLIGYDKLFAEFKIGTYSLSDLKVEKPSANAMIGKVSDWHWLKKATLLVLFSPIILPMILPTLIYVVLDVFVIRGLYYMGVALKQAIKDFFYPEKKSEFHPKNMPAANNADFPKSVAPLDLAVPSHDKPKQCASHRTIASMLDFPLQDLSKVQSRAEANTTIPKFKGVRDSKIGKKSSLPEVDNSITEVRGPMASPRENPSKPL